MTDTITADRTDGLTSFVPGLRNGWQSLGKFYTDDQKVTVEQALADIDAGEIRGVPQYGEFRLSGDRYKIRQPRYQGTYRIKANTDANGDRVIVPLAVVGIDFEIIQDADTFGFLGDLAGDGYNVAAAGLMVHERRTFCCVRLPDAMIGGVDHIDRYLLAYVGHDGGAKLTIAGTNMRTPCHNVVNMTIRKAERKFVIAHRPGANAKMRVELAQKALQLTQSYDAAWATEAERLIATPVSDQKFWDIVGHAYGPKQTEPSTAVQNRWDKVQGDIAALWNADHNANVKGTAWGALNVLNEYNGWFATVRGLTAQQADAKRFEKALLGGNDGDTQHVQNIINALV